MSARGFRSRLAVLAVGLDAVAVVGLVLVVLAAHLRSDAFALVVPGLLLGVAAVPGAGLSAVVLLREAAARGVARGVRVRIAVLLCGFALAIGPAGFALAWALTPNPAADQAAPVLRDLRAAGAVRLCESGDAGRGPDDFSAWQTGFYRMPDDAATPEALRHLFREHGHVLVRRSAEGTPDPHGILLTTARHESDERYLSAELSSGPVDLECTVDGRYGRSFTPPAGQRLLIVSSGAPPSG